MPERSALDESMRLARARLRVQDDDLKQGEVEMVVGHTAAGPLPSPWGIQGGFAVVYKFRTHSNKLRALRCFTVHVETDMQFRYERIGSYFATHVPEITAGFKYHHAGIVVQENVQGQIEKKTYPLIEMEWIEGTTLLEYVDELCRKRDVVKLADLTDQWLALLQKLSQASIAHGDLAGANVMVRSNGRLVLVDYDGVYIPDFAGRLPIVTGQADYQHPHMNQRPFNEQTDAFSALVIYTALQVLQVQPEIWDRYVHCTQQGLLDTSLLFKQQDFIDPDHSSLMSELEKIGDPRVNLALQALRQACSQPVADVRFPSHLLDPEFEQKQALIKLERAIQYGNEEEIIHIWVSCSLDNYTAAQQYHTRVEQAKHLVKMLKRLQDALQTRSIQQIVAAYDFRLYSIKSINKNDREIIKVAENFLAAYNNDDDQTLMTIWQDIQSSRHQYAFVLTIEEEQRIALAERRMSALEHMRRVLRTHTRTAEQILLAYDTVLNDCRQVTPEERALLQSASRFTQMHAGLLEAIRADNDQQIIAIYDEELVKLFPCLTHEQGIRINKAVKYDKLAKVLQSNDYGPAIRLAQDFELEFHEPVTDFQLMLAKQKFIKQFDIKNVQAYMQGNEVIASWNWPSDDLIRYAVIVWRTDRWPHSPKREEAGTERAWVFRSRHEQSSMTTFSVAQQMPVYLQVYLAMPNDAQQPVTWFYSTGKELGSKKVAYSQASNIWAN
jgi:hypothetical protein